MSKKPDYKSAFADFCKYYSRKLDDRPADLTYRFLCSLKFFKDHGYYPRFKNPRSFSEKIWHRMLFDRNLVWTEISDKLKARRLVQDKIGDEYLIPLLWEGTRPEFIPLEKLPERFVVKANHGCGYNIFVKDKKQISYDKIVGQLNRWLEKKYTYSSFLGMEWAYENIEPKIYVEMLIEENGRTPKDYKFFCFSGRAEYLQISFDRFGDASERILDRDFNPIEVWNGVKIYRGVIERPIDYEKMLDVAETLSAGFDFIRVDLYNVKGKIYFGEYTCYPAAGLAPFVPRKWDFIFGEKWIIK